MLFVVELGVAMAAGLVWQMAKVVVETLEQKVNMAVTEMAVAVRAAATSAAAMRVVAPTVVAEMEVAVRVEAARAVVAKVAAIRFEAKVEVGSMKVVKVAIMVVRTRVMKAESEKG